MWFCKKLKAYYVFLKSVWPAHCISVDNSPDGAKSQKCPSHRWTPSPRHHSQHRWANFALKWWFSFSIILVWVTKWVSHILVLCQVCIEAAKTAARHPYNVTEIAYFLGVKGWVYSCNTVWYRTWQHQRKLTRGSSNRETVEWRWNIMVAHRMTGTWLVNQ
jgi:hypothetical protein